MLSRMLQILLLTCVAATCVQGAMEWCHGQNLSAYGMEDVDSLYEMLNKTRCTHVIGDIILTNLTDVALPMDIYRRVRKVFGSISIWNNTNLNPIHFPALRTINATLLPAITFLANRNVIFSVGNQFKKAITNNSRAITFAVLKNKNFVLDTAQYNLWYLAGYPKSKFLFDSTLLTRVCGENLYKPIAGILGFLFVALTVAFSTVAFYDRPKLA